MSEKSSSSKTTPGGEECSLVEEIIAQHEVEREQEGSQESVEGKGKGVKRSQVYNFFVQDAKTLKWKCTVGSCRIVLANPKSGGTGSMVNHLKHCHRNAHLKFLQLSSSSASATKNKMTAYVTVQKAEQPAVFDKEEYKRKIVKFFVMTNQPFSNIEDESLQDLMMYAAKQDPDATLPNRKQLREMINELYKEKFENLKNMLRKNSSKISFSVDCWTSKNGHAFQGVVAHWIDDDWNLQNLVLDLSKIEGSHTGANLAENFGNVLSRFEIWDKLLAVTSDNAANMNTFAVKLEKLASENSGSFNAANFRIRCMAHIINLSCQLVIKSIEKNMMEEMDVEEGDDDDDDDDDEAAVPGTQISFVNKIRKASVAIRGSPQRREKLAKQCEAAGIQAKNVILDVRTRWNSTLDMLERAIELKKPLQMTIKSIKKLRHLVQTTADWALAEKTIRILKPFKDATELLSEEGIPKLSQTLSIYNALFEHLEQYIDPKTTTYRDRQRNEKDNAIDEILRTAAEAGWEKLTEYYPSTDGLVYQVATVLDPRFKCQWFSVAGWKKSWITQCKSAVRRAWVSGYKEQSESETTTNSSEEPHFSGLKNAILQKFKSQNEEYTNDELSRYLSEQTESYDAIKKLSSENEGKDGVLCWWKNNRSSFPRLSKMARDFLAASGTGVPVERLFSAATDLLSQRRQSMAAETIQECLCLRSWYKGLSDKVILEEVAAKAKGDIM